MTPYIRHPAAVAAALEAKSPEIRAAAWLHDLLEITPLTAAQLKAQGIPGQVVDLVKILTHAPGESLETYWARVKRNPAATIVKLADIDHNMRDCPTQYQRHKYAKARSFFHSRLSCDHPLAMAE